MLWTFVWTSSFHLLVVPPPGTIRINCRNHIFLLLPKPTFFSERVISVWNALPADVIDFGSVKKFRCSLLKVHLSNFTKRSYFSALFSMFHLIVWFTGFILFSIFLISIGAVSAPSKPCPSSSVTIGVCCFYCRFWTKCIWYDDMIWYETFVTKRPTFRQLLVGSIEI